MTDGPGIVPGSMPGIVVVGGGLAGAAFALHLLRDHGDRPARLTLLEPAALPGAGLAYSTAEPTSRVNVAATRMSLFGEAPADFDDWLRRQGVPARDPAATVAGGGLFPQRAAFGRYVAERLAEAVAAAPAMAFRHRRARATAIRRAPGGFLVTLDDGGVLPAGCVVLATGHLPPALPAPLRTLSGDARLVADPWDMAALDRVSGTGDVLVLGTGLTGCDVVAALRRRGHAGRILALSRHGLLPRPRTPLPVGPAGDFATAPATGATALLRRVRAAVAAEVAAGRPWENVIAALREQAPAVWGALPLAEKRRALRHLRAWWDVHRFQSAPQIDALLRREIAAGGVLLLAGSLLEARPEADGIHLLLRPRGAPAAAAAIGRTVSAVVNCTGPAHGQALAANPALRSLWEAGAILPDPCGLGIAVDGAGRALDAAGAAQPDLLVAGPPARGTYGELMGLPQMTDQPRALARLVAQGLPGGGEGGAAGHRPAPPARSA
ncbi:FAD/NAD(P)-binding protein [Roseomonas sp. NAR14]|uniref:FAD/NAD(P)-binding protein n=1 Tax=Roseomonas acroporae TaxID=2937791 RepID=A0A9X2BXA7_9PROT|nr:FAD/NAD(P)-binding protein [Roseomonas acroporae]MCK8787001.1 FAD/NAD(P)-binding protein [Roseomonas acroporae]